jgi:hypothetical protein
MLLVALYLVDLGTNAAGLGSSGHIQAKTHVNES